MTDERDRLGVDDDPRAFVDVRIDSAGREGLAGTTPASMYRPRREPDEFTLPPDGRPMEAQPRWRREFPVDWPRDHYVARRDFTKFMVLTSFAFVVGQAWIIVQNWRRRRAGRPEAKRIASLREIAVGQATVFHYPGEADNCVLIRTGEGDAGGAELVAFSQKCTHLTCAVIPDVANGVIRCPCHEGYFDLRTGVVLAGPPPRPLTRILLELHGDDIYAVGVERRTV